MTAPRVGLVLGGGGARGAFTAGVVSYLRYNAVQPIKNFPVISGTSTGALVGALACLHQFAKLEKVYTTIKAGDIINPNQSLVASTLGVEAGLFASILFGDAAVFSSAALRQIIDKNINFDRIVEHASKSRLLLNTVDLQTGCSHVFDNATHNAATLKEALLASASEPVFMPPVEIDGGGGVAQHIDGGVRELIPLAAAFRSGVEVDFFVVVLTNPVEPEARSGRMSGILPVLGRTIELALAEVAAGDVATAEYLNALVSVQRKALALAQTDPSLAQLPAQLFEDVPERVAASLAGKRSVPIVTVAPPTRLQVESLDFDAACMKEMFDLGWDTAVDIVEPAIVEHLNRAGDS